MIKSKIIIGFLFATIISCSEQKEYTFSDVRNAIEKSDHKELDEIFQTITINATDSFGNTSLILAVKKNNLQLVSFLLTNGADPNLSNNEELMPLDIARENNYTEINTTIKEFQYYDWLKETDKFSEEAFEFAIGNDNTKIVTDFLKNGRDVETVCISKEIAPLIEALFTDSYGVIKVLLENNANPNVSFDTRPAITISALFNQYEVTKMLLAQGADVNGVDGPLTTALMLAAEEGNLEVVKLLLANGANTKLIDKREETALDKAIKNNHQNIIELLSQ